jgi:hypothetical protein
MLDDVTSDGRGIGGETDSRELVQPQVIDGVPSNAGADGEQVTRPAKLVRIASMVHSLLDEVRLAPLDDAGRRRLREIHHKSIQELKEILSPDLRTELNNVVLPFTSDPPSESELRLAQAQLVGWLEGLFHGIQATLFTQQAMAQGQLEEMRRRALEPAPRAVPGPYL